MQLHWLFLLGNQWLGLGGSKVGVFNSDVGGRVVKLAILPACPTVELLRSNLMFRDNDH